MKLVGRKQELQTLMACLKVGRNVLLEGPVGAGKTFLALSAIRELGRPVFRIDGDSRYTEQKLSGWFDPPLVLKKGYSEETFCPGPLVDAMRAGGVLFINELNRLPEGVQNILLPAIDEKLVVIPRLGEIRAKPGFVVIATQNPKEFVATSHLSEAILDRFELVVIDYQSKEEETKIVKAELMRLDVKRADAEVLASAAVALVRLTRAHEKVRRGSSVRGAISSAELAAGMIEQGARFDKAFISAATIALPTRIDFDLPRNEVEELIRSLAKKAIQEVPEENRKKQKKKR